MKTHKDRMVKLLELAKQSTCTRLKVACHLRDYKDKSIAVTCNRAVTWAPKCTGEKGSCGCLHAEMHALNYKDNAKTMYITHSPCVYCAQLIVKSPIRQVYYVYPYRDKRGLTILKRYGIKTERIKV